MPKDAAIIDHGAGTGMAARFLVKEGFTNLVALDGSGGMLEVAKKEGNYKEYHEVFLGIGKLPEELKGRFHVAMCVGLFVQSHVPPSCIGEMIETMKGEKGDVLIFAIRDDSYLVHGFKEYLDKLEDEGRI